MNSMRELADKMYKRARLAECELDALQARLNVMRGVALIGWVGFLLHVWGV